MILELRNLTKTQREHLQNYYDSLYKNGILLPPFEEFDEMGLKYPVEHLASIGKYVIFFPVEIMANYADQITSNYIDTDNTSFLDFFSKSIQNVMRNFDMLNTTSIGNLAYCYLHSKSGLVKKAAKEQLDFILSKMELVISKEITEMNIKYHC